MGPPGEDAVGKVAEGATAPAKPEVTREAVLAAAAVAMAEVEGATALEAQVMVVVAPMAVGSAMVTEVVRALEARAAEKVVRVEVVDMALVTVVG